jgi:ubiquinone/menaquinone biosynthesis C-methylase UbiE
MTEPHDKRVDAQFGPRAQAYVASAVHSQGEDLKRIEAIAAEVRPARALDLGTGGGHVAYALARHAGVVVACDFSAEMLAAVSATARAKGLANVETSEASVERLPFADQSFDLVASRFSAHHWRHFEGGVAEARRVAKPGARAVFVDCYASEVPLFDTHLQAVELLRDVSHVRDHSLSQWLKTLGRAGFSTQSLNTWRLRMDFPVWTARMATPEPLQRAIRDVQHSVSAETAAYFAIEPDGSFEIEVALIDTIVR